MLLYIACSIIYAMYACSVAVDCRCLFRLASLLWGWSTWCWGSSSLLEDSSSHPQETASIFSLFLSSILGTILYHTVHNGTTRHCAENLKHIFPEMKQRGLVPTIYIHISGNNLYIPKIGLIWNIYFPALHQENSQRNHMSGEKGRERPPSIGKCQFPALPYPPVSSHKWPTYKFPSWKITDHKWKQLILVVNLLFGLRVILTTLHL